MKKNNIRMMKKSKKEAVNSKISENLDSENVNLCVIEDPANVFKLAMLERDLEKLQLQHQLSMKHIDEQSMALSIKKTKSLSLRIIS